MKPELIKDDYEEPRCLLNMNQEAPSIPVRRIIEKLDYYLNKKDYASAERHLQYWASEASSSNDMRGKLTVLNEQIGFYRKTNQQDKCLSAISAALALAENMDITYSVAYGTTLVNAATGYKAFENNEKALEHYRKAQVLYEKLLAPTDERLGSLYNNLAVTLTGLKEYEEAEAYYLKAIDIMSGQENGRLEVAVTYLNLADLVAAKSGLDFGAELIETYLQTAERLLNDETIPRDGYYAFVCTKCAPVFGYYGFFQTEKELQQKASEIIERS